MAMKKKSTKRSRSAKKFEPAVRYLRYDVQNSGTVNTETSHFIDLAKDLSAVNRRLYRQGRHYHVKRITVVSSNTPNVGTVTDPSSGAVMNNGARVSFSTAPNSWVACQAHKRAAEVFKQMNHRAMENVAGADISGTWADFKVYLSTDHRNGTKLNPIDNGGNAVSAGEWIYSRFISPDGTTGEDEFDGVLLGDHVGSAGSRVSVGLIKSYGESRATVTFGDPAVPGTLSDDPLLNVFDWGTEVDEVLNRLESDNDTPPYDQANYPGDDANMPKPLVAQDTTLVDGKATVGGFTALCGLIEVESKSPVANDVFSVLVELAPGNYRGIKADVI
jgi:hypothetical protein